MNVERTIFRAYDIRGVYGKTISEEVFEAIGNVSRRLVDSTIIVGMDHRTSSPSLKEAFIRGARRAGLDVTDIGMVPRGAAMFWSWKKKIPCAYISASHLPPEWNGIKFVEPNGGSFSQGKYRTLAEMVAGDDFVKDGKGNLQRMDVLKGYKKFLMERLPSPKKPLKVLLDCGNGTAGIVVEEVFRAKGFKPEVLFGEPDGRFPNRESELVPKALEKAKQKARDFDITIAFDGDADRIAAIDNEGNIIKPEVLAYIIMRELLKGEKGPIVANVECSRIIESIAQEFGRKVHRTPVGYTFVIKGVLETNACFGIERSMHFCIPSVMPFDDGIVAALYAAYAASKIGSVVKFIGGVPTFSSKQVNYECSSDSKKIEAMARLRERLLKEYPNANTMDGVRVDFEQGWVLIRQSNTSPLIRMTLEADSQGELVKLERDFGKMVEDEIRE